MKRLVAAITLVVVVVLVAGAALVVTRDSSGDDAGPTPVAPSGGPPARPADVPDLARFYSQRLDWSACTGSASEGDQCARLTVPLDYRRPSGPTIEISLLKVPASGSRIGSLVVNPGGPGAPRYVVRRRSRHVVRRAAARALRHRRLRPARHRRQLAGRLPVRPGHEPLPRRRPRRRPRRPRSRRTTGSSRQAGARVQRALRRRWRPTCRPSRQPATWTSCAPRWASGR